MKRIVAILLSALLLPIAAAAEGGRQSTLTVGEARLHTNGELAMDLSKLGLELGVAESDQGESLSAALTADGRRYDVLAALEGDRLTLTASFLDDAYRLYGLEKSSVALADVLGAAPWAEAEGAAFSVPGELELTAETHDAFELTDLRLDEVLGGAGPSEPFHLKADRYFAPASGQTGGEDVTAYVFTLQRMGSGPDRPYAQARLYDFRGGAGQTHRAELAYSFSRDDPADTAGRLSYDGKVEKKGDGGYRETGTLTWTDGAQTTLTANVTYDEGPAPEALPDGVGKKNVVDPDSMDKEQATALQRQLTAAVCASPARSSRPRRT